MEKSVTHVSLHLLALEK